MCAVAALCFCEASGCGGVAQTGNDAPGGPCRGGKLDDGCTEEVCHAVLRLRYDDLSIEQYALFGGPLNGAGEMGALQTVDDLFATHGIANGQIDGPHAGVLDVVAPPSDFGADALVGADSGIVLFAGPLGYAGGRAGEYWVTSDWRSDATTTCNTGAKPADSYVDPGECLDGISNAPVHSGSDAEAAALSTTLAAGFATHGAFSLYTHLYVPIDGACDASAAEWIAVFSRTSGQ